MSKLTYKKAGVDLTKANSLVTKIKPIINKTKKSSVWGNFGGFSGGFQLPKGYDEPILISSTDGVGTKLKLAIQLNKQNTIGIDLVAMCVNDIIVSGAKPLFFLDYYATSSIDIDHVKTIISGIAEGCIMADCALIGGETAEMPNLYKNNDYDLAGFGVGIVDKKNIIDGSQITRDNIIIGIESSGAHANGYSLIHKIMSQTNFSQALLKQLLTPTRIYVKPILELVKKVPVLGMAHITGGGLIDNIPRVLPKYLSAVIDKNSWQMPNIFKLLQTKGNITNNEMFRVFNCGIGMVVIVDKKMVPKTLQILNKSYQAWIIGKITDGKNKIIIN